MDTGLLSFFQHILKCFFIIHNGLCICHTHNGGKTSSGSSSRTCMDIFFVSQSRITEMYMDIHQTWCYYKAFCIKHLIRSCFCLWG